MIPLTDIQDAARRIGGDVLRTPLLSCRTLGERVEARLYLKCECFQKTGSFKARGALNKVLSLKPDQTRQGLITVSAGNHAQAVAWAARQVDAPCAVVMPSDAPRSKVDAVRGYGAEIVFHDDRHTLFDRLRKEQTARGAVFIHPFDDATVLAGAGTAGLEIVEDLPDVDVVIVPVGGGGLMTGVASAVKGLRPEARIVAVELEAGPGLTPALEAGRPVAVKRPPDTLADGMTPPFVGELPLKAAQAMVDEVVLVTEEQIIEAMSLLMARAKIYVEASGAAATAALLARRGEIRAGARVVSVVSGGNIDLATMCVVLGKASL